MDGVGSAGGGAHIASAFFKYPPYSASAVRPVDTFDILTRKILDRKGIREIRPPVYESVFGF
jgi:hypothetical protein